MSVDEKKKAAWKTPGRNKRRKNSAKNRRIVLGAIAALVVVYVGTSIYFMHHFYPQTTLNGRSVGGYSAKKVKSVANDDIHSSVLKLKTRDGKPDEIAGSAIDLEPQWNDDTDNLIKKQNGFAWPVKLFQKETLKSETLVAFDEEKTKRAIDGLECLDESKKVDPENAGVSSYSEKDGYTIVPCVMGTKIDDDKMYKAVDDAVNGLVEKLNLDKAGVYINPTVLDDNKELAHAVDSMNKYSKASITYQIGKSSEVLDASVYSDWMRLNKNLKPVLSKRKVEEYVNTLAKKYNTCYMAKKLKTSYGKTVTIPLSHYGWKVDNEAEVNQIIDDIKAGKAVTRDLNYSMTANSHDGNDFGDSYVEINLTAQHLFLYKKGKLVIETDFVSGNVSKGNATPTGAYGITYTEKNATLRGENYETPVTYWMPFAGNVGMHDAYWRSSFGGSIYKTAGSHGCINLPPSAAKVIFENVSKNYPVLVYELEGTEANANVDQKAAEAVDKLIAAIGDVTLDSKDVIDKAQKAYDKLNSNAKSKVKNYQILVDAKKKLGKLEKKNGE